MGWDRELIDREPDHGQYGREELQMPTGQDSSRLGLPRIKAAHDFTRFDTIMEALQHWRNKDHSDNISLHRNQVIEIIEGVRALRA